MLQTSAGPLAQDYDLIMLDLDGVVYIDGRAVPGAPENLADVRAAGGRMAFITNNASRDTATVAAHLNDLGIPADAQDVVSSAQAAARLLRSQHAEGARVAVLGAESLRSTVAEAGLTPVSVQDDAVALVTGYGPDVPWREVMQAAVRVAAGLAWTATNTDLSINTRHGMAPGHGVMVDMISRFTGATAQVAGKPARPLFDETVLRTGATHPLMVGDRLDTDIDGARAAGFDALLVLTGVTGLPELVSAPPDLRPTHISRDLHGLNQAHPAPDVAPDGTSTCGGWTATAVDGRLRLSGDGAADDWWRAAATASWAWLDSTGQPVDVAGIDSTP